MRGVSEQAVSNRYVTNIDNGRISTSEFFGKTWKYSDESELIEVIQKLIELNYAFVYQPGGWPPAAILEDLQERGLLDKEFTAITWTGKGQETFRVKPK